MNKLLIFTAPSGAGKTTIVRHLLQRYPQLAFSISATTRTQRANEIDGQDYYFLSPTAFKQQIAQGDFLEWEEVYPEKFYGTLKSEVNRLWAMDKCVVFDIDVKGALNIKATYPEETLAIFVNPPSFQTLVARLQARQTEDDQSLKDRIQKAKTELLYVNSFDAALYNDDLTKALVQAEEMVATFLGAN